MALGEEVQEALRRQRHAAAALEITAALEREDAARRHAPSCQRDDIVDRGAGRHQRATHAEQQERHRRAHPHLSEPLAAHVGEIDVERHRGLAVVVPFLREDRLHPRHQGEGIALGEVERADQPGPEPLRALPFDPIAVVAAHGHELLAQEAIDGATDRLDWRFDDAADDHAARPQRAGEGPLLFRLDWRTPAHLGQRLLDRGTRQTNLVTQADQLGDAQRLGAGTLRRRRRLDVDLGRPAQNKVDLRARELVRHDARL